MTRPTTELDPRLAKALAHPLRLRILGLLEQGSSTPKELARRLGVPLGNVSYHVRALRDHGFLELEHTRVVRGAVEHRYRVLARPRITAETWAELPAIVREAFDAAAVSGIVDEVGRALAQDGFDDPNSGLARMAFEVDDDGYAEASKVVADALERFGEIEARAKERLQGRPGRPLVAVSMLFDQPADGARVPEREHEHFNGRTERTAVAHRA
jgi:DNA-binding transcriptional ArsR family regulator